MCVDEDPIVGVKKNLPFASLIHFKDFYFRPYDQHPGAGEWFTTAYGNFLRGSIVGQGDIEIRKIVKLIKASGYDGYITVEFEGMEGCRAASRAGMDNLRRFWEKRRRSELFGLFTQADTSKVYTFNKNGEVNS